MSSALEMHDVRQPERTLRDKHGKWDLLLAIAPADQPGGFGQSARSAHAHVQLAMPAESADLGPSPCAVLTVPARAV